MLFNVEEDPDELTNVAEEHKDVVAKLDRRLRKEIDPDKVNERVARDDWVRHMNLEVDGQIRQMLTEAEEPKYDAWVQEGSHLFGGLRDLRSTSGNSTAALAAPLARSWALPPPPSWLS